MCVCVFFVMQYKIGEDLGGPENWECQGDVFQITKVRELAIKLHTDSK